MWITDCRQIAFCYLVPILQLYELMLLQATTLLENEYIKLSFFSSDNIYMMVTTSISNCITSSWSLLLITQYYKYSLGIYLWVIYCCPLRLCCGRYMCCLISSLVDCKHLTTHAHAWIGKVFTQIVSVSMVVNSLIQDEHGCSKTICNTFFNAEIMH